MLSSMDGDRFDLTSVSLRHYRSIGSATVRLGRLNLLVGPNGSGKSNFVDSLRLVSQALNENLDNALRERGGVSEVRRRSTGHPTHFSIELHFRVGALSGSYEFTIGAVRGGDFKVSAESCEVADSSTGQTARFEVRDGQLLEATFSLAPKVSTDRLFLVAVSGMPEFRPVFDGLAGINVYNLNPDAMRAPQRPDPGDLLRRDGSNAASVLEELNRSQPKLKGVVEEYLRSIVPGIVGVDRVPVGAWETLEVRQAVEGSTNPWRFQPTSVSDGTLRALGVLLGLYSPNGPVWSPVGVEEPETALHPAAAGFLLDALVEASDLRQVLATTHSPELLDSETLKVEHLLSVRKVKGETRIDKVNDPSFQAIKDGLFTPGELLRADQLDPAAPAADTTSQDSQS